MCDCPNCEPTSEAMKAHNEVYNEHCKNVYFPARRAYLKGKMSDDRYLKIRERHHELIAEYDKLTENL